MQNRFRVLVIGASGKVGKDLIKGLTKPSNSDKFEVFGTYNSHKTDNLEFLDMSDKQSVKNIFEKIKPQIVIQPAAITFAEYCEENQDQAWKINVEGTKNVAEECKSYQSKFVYLSSDYVYDGQGGPYSEDNPTRPINYFGKTKVEAEKIIQTLDRYLIIRTAWINDFSSTSKSFVMQVINSLSNGSGMQVPKDQFGHPTLSSNLVDMIIELILNEKNGIFHVTGSTYIDRYSFALKIAKAFGLEGSLIKGVSSEELNQKARRPKNVNLKLDKLKQNITTKVLSLDEQLDIMRKNYNPPINIRDVKIIPLGRFRDPRGSLTVLTSKGRDDAPEMLKIEEVYLSDIPMKGTIRAGHKHLKTDEYFTILDGSAKFVFIDDRKESSSFGKVDSFLLNGEYRSALFAPSGVYHVLISLEDNTKCLAVSSKAYHKDDTDTIPAPDGIFIQHLKV